MSEKPNAVFQPLYTADDVKLIERAAVAIAGYDLFELMQRAGQSAYNVMRDRWPNATNIAVVAGSGNNAGDGFILASLAQCDGLKVQVLYVNDTPEYRGDALLAHDKLIAESVKTDAFSKEHLKDVDVIVDGILGTGIKGHLRPRYENVIRIINDHKRMHTNVAVLALDIPSGLEADTGVIDPVALRSDHCVSFIDLKPGMVTGKAREYCPSWEVADLDIPHEARTEYSPIAWCDDAKKLVADIPRRSKVAHKGNYGHLLLIGGDYGFGGAILMAAQAAARVGTGKLTILTRDSHVSPILSQLPEAMIRSIETPADPILDEMLSSVDAVVIGPGLGQGEWGQRLITKVTQTLLPLLVDADGLNHLAKVNERNDNWVLTPHPGEAGRLLQTETAEVETNRYSSVRSIQEQYSGVVVLKGAGTLVADAKYITVCTEGNPGMATGGMGDILSGVIGAFLAQGYESTHAARLGVNLHAMAGDIAAEQGETGLLATDLLEPLRQLVNH